MSDRIRAAILDLALQRGRDKSLCPSEVAKALSADWRPLMPEVRAVAAATPEIVATQGGIEVDPLAAQGPIRLRLR
ncbi:DUF3253 domain-containing protein [Rhodobacter sp. SY28-1]|uniref:DUF3253 domain-containing protein n=1 Tax=Rhodobacter sp. SY28-1 TaxID=2562317 RepID=UPI0010BFDFAD|nr:DUF3253 domain-containing protein [Rhodobacter sp. SY28-1]